MSEEKNIEESDKNSEVEVEEECPVAGYWMLVLLLQACRLCLVPCRFSLCFFLRSFIPDDICSYNIE